MGPCYSVSERVAVVSDLPVLGVRETIAYPKVSPRVTRAPCREIRRVDPSFTMDGFALEMRDELVPEIVSAFLRSDRDTLNARCSERAMAQLSAALRQREAEGLTVDPNILSINNVDVKAAQVREKGPSVLVFQAMVQQINCTRNRKGEIVEGKDDEIRAVYYAFAVHRVYNEVTTELEWRIDEMAIIGAVLYL